MLDEYTKLNVDSNPNARTGIFSRSGQGQNILHCAAHSQKQEIANMLLAHPVFLGLSQAQKKELYFILYFFETHISSDG